MNWFRNTFTSALALVAAVLAGSATGDCAQVAKFGINYRFGWGGPLVARY